MSKKSCCKGCAEKSGKKEKKCKSKSCDKPKYRFDPFQGFYDGSFFRCSTPWRQWDFDDDDEKCKDKKYKDPDHYLNKALFYYYNQHPTFTPCAQPGARSR